MLRDKLTKQLDHDPHFAWRGQVVTRIENLSDIVFALALGMLVSSSNPPQTYAQLLPHLITIIPIAAGFAVMLLIWNHHFTFFRRYGVADTKIITINAALLLLILFVAYPLRFAFDSLFAFIELQFGNEERMLALGIATHREAGNIISWFYIGITVIYFLLHWMYKHAESKADILRLTPSEIAITRRSIWMFRGEIVIGVSIALLAFFTFLGPFAAMLGILNWPVAIVTKRLIKVPKSEAGEA